jgi:2-C-methyl-D-erythritol 4-phosphate cytidylyltransferase
MRNYAIITAAGKGSRFGSLKALYPLRGKPLLVWSLEVFSKIADQIVVTFPPGSEESFRAATLAFHNVNYISGGETRFLSVKKAVESLQGKGIVLIHDAARPLVSHKLVEQVLLAAEQSKAAIPVLPVAETVKEVIGNVIERTIPRDRLYVAQTPQAFDLEILNSAYASAERNDYTDEAMLVEFAGQNVFCVPGERRNIKITEPFDIRIAETLLEEGSH